MPDITARFTLTGEDYEAYLRYFYQHTRAGRRHMRRLYALGVALFLLFVGLEYDHPRFGVAHPAYFAAYLMISAALMGGAYYYGITRLWPAIAQAAVKRSPHRDMFAETTVTFEKDALAIETDSGSGRLPWSQVSETASTDAYLLLFTGGINAFIIPTRGFESLEKAEEAASFARDHAPGATRR